GSSAQSGRALRDGDRRRLVIGLSAALIGGPIGAVLLLLTPAEACEALVPFLVAGAATALLVQPVQRRWATSHA
ncbi:sulfite exporter TauE/SafE family protein, partial [Gordonia alkanivorans]|nr:sulfite exporter TauE/SafE family protein [Gordonia alkanivorans]